MTGENFPAYAESTHPKQTLTNKLTVCGMRSARLPAAAMAAATACQECHPKALSQTSARHLCYLRMYGEGLALRTHAKCSHNPNVLPLTHTHFASSATSEHNNIRQHPSEPPTRMPAARLPPRRSMCASINTITHSNANRQCIPLARYRRLAHPSPSQHELCTSSASMNFCFHSPTTTTTYVSANLTLPSVRSLRIALSILFSK